MTDVEKYLENTLRETRATIAKDEAMQQIKKEVNSIMNQHVCFSCVKSCKESLITGQLTWCPQYSKNFLIKFWYWIRSFI